MKLGIMRISCRFMAQKIPAGSGVEKRFVVLPRPLADRKGYHAVGIFGANAVKDVTKPLSLEIRILAALQDKGALAACVAGVTTGENVLF